MKRQYLGDAKDSFKWDYHDYLARELRFPRLTVALMMTPDDMSKDGRTKPEWFPARSAVIQFCHDLRACREVGRVVDLPLTTGARYQVVLHRADSYITNDTRAEYFSGFDSGQDQIVFLDPDNGLEPEESFCEKHVRYRDVSAVLEQLTDDSLVTVFQHFRYVSFPEDFARIRERLESSHATAIYWHSLMFVAIAASERSLRKVIAANAKYASISSLKVIT